MAEGMMAHFYIKICPVGSCLHNTEPPAMDGFTIVTYTNDRGVRNIPNDRATPDFTSNGLVFHYSRNYSHRLIPWHEIAEVETFPTTAQWGEQFKAWYDENHPMTYLEFIASRRKSEGLILANQIQETLQDLGIDPEDLP